MANTAEVLEVQSPTTKDLLSSTYSLEFDSLVFWMEMRYSWPYLVFFGHMGRFGIVISICFINNDYRHSETSTVLSVSLHCSGKDIRDPLQPVLQNDFSLARVESMEFMADHSHYNQQVADEVLTR